MLVERLERWALVGHLSASVRAAAGAEVRVPSPAETLDRFEEWLSSPLEQRPETAADPDLAELERVIGVA